MKNFLLFIGVACLALFLLIGILVLEERKEEQDIETGKIVGMQMQAEAYTKGVPLEQVPLKGDVVFEARIKIVYKDGKLVSVDLIPSTTTKIINQ